MSELSDFVLSYLRQVGALVEPPAYGVYEVLLPEEVAARLGIPPFQRLAFDEEVAPNQRDESVTLLHYAHPLVDRMVEAVRETPANARLYINAVRLDKHGLSDLAQETLFFPNAHLSEVPGAEEALTFHHYVRFNFKASLITDEKRELIVPVWMHVQGGYALEDGERIEQLALLEPWPVFDDLPTAPPVWRPEEDPLSRPVLAELLERASRARLEALAGPLETLRRRARRLLELDQARLEQYYNDLRRDLERRSEAADGDRRAALEEKRSVLEAERQEKLSDVEEKHRLKVALELINLLVVVQPKLVLPMQVKTRRTTVTRSVVWDPLRRQLEPLVCDVCGQPSAQLCLCEGGHLAHQECLLPPCVDCKRRYCRRCADQVTTCVVCGQPVCVPSLNRCPTCGRGTCHEHVGLCHAADGKPVQVRPAAPPPAPAEPAPSPERDAELRKSSVSSAAKQKKETPPRPKEKPEETKRKAEQEPPFGRRMDLTGQQIEVYVEMARPLVTAFVIASGREAAVRTWTLEEDGITVDCACEKGLFCPADGMLIRPESADRIEEQVWHEILTLRDEYQVPGRRISFYRVIYNRPHPQHRLMLVGRWKDETALAQIRATFDIRK